MKRIAIAAIAAVFALALVGSGAWPFPNSGTTDSGTPESIAIGSSAFELNALIYIADDQGYFTANGLNVTMLGYSLSGLAIHGMEKGEVDISLSGEYSIVSESFKKENISVIGCIDKSSNSVLVCRKDRGIESVLDLRGKKIGISEATQAAFIFGRYLELNGLNTQDIEFINLNPLQYVDAMSEGSVDGVVVGYSYADRIKERMGSNISIWRIYKSQPYYWVMAGRNGWIASHPEAINKLLKSLGQAEEYSINQPNESKAIVQKRLNYTDAYMAEIWPHHRFSLTLDQSLVLAMEDEARWMIKNNLTTEKTIPNFRDYIHTKGLEQVKPGCVNIIG